MIWPLLRGLGRNLGNFFVGIFVQTMTPKGHFEINWPLLTHSYSISKYDVEFSENIVGFWTLHFLKKRKEIAVKVQNEKVRSDTEGFLFCSAIRNPVWWSRDHEDKALFCKLGQVTLLKTLVFDPHPPCNRANMFLNLQF